MQFINLFGAFVIIHQNHHRRESFVIRQPDLNSWKNKKKQKSWSNYLKAGYCCPLSPPFHPPTPSCSLPLPADVRFSLLPSRPQDATWWNDSSDLRDPLANWNKFSFINKLIYVQRTVILVCVAIWRQPRENLRKFFFQNFANSVLKKKKKKMAARLVK